MIFGHYPGNVSTNVTRLPWSYMAGSQLFLRLSEHIIAFVNNKRAKCRHCKVLLPFRDKNLSSGRMKHKIKKVRLLSKLHTYSKQWDSNSNQKETFSANRGKYWLSRDTCIVLYQYKSLLFLRKWCQFGLQEFSNKSVLSPTVPRDPTSHLGPFSLTLTWLRLSYVYIVQLYWTSL